MTGPARHSLDLVNRGGAHVHRWQGSCSCGGWASPPFRNKSTVTESYRLHTNAARNRSKAPERRRPTPVELLPDGLA